MAERAMSAGADPLEAQIGQWREFLRRRQAIRAPDVAELEDHLRGQVAELREAGLSDDEAFLVAVKRMGALDTISSEFAREHSERLWKQLAIAPAESAGPAAESRTEMIVVFALAVAAAILVKLPEWFGLDRTGGDDPFYWRNASFFFLPLLTGYFVWKRELGQGTWMGLAAAFAAAMLVANAYPLRDGSATFALAVIHLPIALWLLVGIAYAGGRWRESTGRMDFVRFSGELLIYYALIALGGGVLVGITIGMFQAIGIDAERFVESWLPCGMVGAVIVGAWLVEAKKSVIENMAPVLTRLFTPLFAIALLVFLGTMAWTGRGIDIERNALIAFDLLLVLLVASALVADAFALAAIAARISEFGYTPNRVAALGFNVILLGNLAWSAVLYVRFLRGRGTFAALERWQTAYLPVFPAWAAIVVVVFPPLFAFR